MFIADLQIHSKYSRATSKNMDLDEITKYAKIKGLDVVGTGDFTHPLWLKELKQKLIDVNNGVYMYDDVMFILTGEISLIYTQGGKQRRVHHVILAPNFSVLDQINEWLDKKGRRDYDGRPIFGFNSVELVENLMSISKDIEIIPAHAWTPWYGIFGSMSGFDSLEECFRDKTKYIHTIETGMSSDPALNWRISALDDITLTSNSDAHSAWPWRLGREANVFDFREITYDNVIGAFRTRKDFAFTIETSPSYGKYHYDGHRACNFSCSPEQSKKLKEVCPKCGKKLTIGVMYRVEQLADREEGFVPKGMVPFKTLIPLSEVIAAVFDTEVFSKKVWEVYNRLIDRFDNEFNILLNVPADELKKTVDEKLAELIIKNRENKLHIEPGYDGVYGKLIIKEEQGLRRFIK